MCIYMHCVCVHIDMDVYTAIYACAYIYVCVQPHVGMDVYIYICMDVHIYISMDVYIYIQGGVES